MMVIILQLDSMEERLVTRWKYFSEDELRCKGTGEVNMDEKFMDQGEVKISISEDYNSHNTNRLDSQSMKELLLKLEFMQKIIQGEHADPED